MAAKPSKSKQAEAAAPAERRARILALLTPAGRAFAKRLEKALETERAFVNNQAMEAIMARIDAMHLTSPDSVKAVNQLAENRAGARVTACYMIMNYANFLIDSGQYATGRGELDHIGSHLLSIWRRYARSLVDKKEISEERYDAEEKKLMAKVAEMGRGSGGIIRAVTSVFRKKKS